MAIDSGKIFGQILGPIVNKIKQVTGPLDPVIKTLYAPIPVLSDLSHLVGGDDTGKPAVLAPGENKSIGTLQVYEHLTFNSDGVYNFGLDSDQAIADQVKADLVDIYNATFSPVDRGSTTLPVGTSFVVINSTGPSGILGTFSNLPDHSTITIGNNTFRADYFGGDGNDLTLTVAP